MAKFNPDDFVLHDINPENGRKTILEYDAKHKMILVRMVNNAGEYVYKYAQLNGQLNQNLLDNLPDEWSNDRDRIFNFGIYDDGEFVLIKEKMKFDFKSQQSYWRQYEVEDFTYEQAKELFNVLKSILFVQQTIESEQKNQQVLEIVNKKTYLNQKYSEQLEERDKLLRESDFRVLEDYPEYFAGEKEMWKQWREELRNCVKSPDDFDDTLDYIIYKEAFKFPVDPLVYKEMYPNTDVEYLSTDDQYTTSTLSASTAQQEQVSKTILKSAEEIKRVNEQGIPVEKQVYDIIEKYKLLDDVLDLDVSKLAIKEN